MPTLFSDSEVFQKERPTEPTELQLENFYAEQAKEIIKQGFATDDEESVIEDLRDLYPFFENGYEMAKDLEGGNASYKIDTSFCEFLDGLSSGISSILRKNVRDWIKAHNPQPKFKDGERLMIVETINRGMQKGMIVYVNYKREDEAIYIVDADNTKKGGTILAYERAEKCCVVA